MDFAFLPPEVNSTRMYTGPGSSSLLAAAGSWDALAAELDTTAGTYESVISGLTALQWHGPASASMAAAASPYVDWLYSTAEQTKQTATQARTAAMAFEQAYAMTVPPLVVTANRTLLQALVATNFFGQNTAAIATTETQYAEMWAQDAAAMFGYQTSSAAAAQLTPFTSPQQSSNPEGVIAQSTAVAQAAAADPVSGLIAAVVQALPVFNGDFGILDITAAVYATISGSQDIEAFVAGVINSEANLGLIPEAAEVPAAFPPILTAVSQSGGGAGLSNAILASAGRANSIGPLSVPASWAAPSTRAVSALSPAGLTTFTGTEETAGSGVPGVPGMPAPTLARGSGVLPRYGVRLTVMAHPPAAG